jgi:hypothetical protein
MPRENMRGPCASSGREVLFRTFYSDVQPCFRGRVIGSIALLSLLMFPASVLAQTAARPKTAKTETETPLRQRDLSGLWFGGQGGGLRVNGNVARMLPEAQARFDANTAELKSDRTISADPTFRCEPPGVPHIYGIGGYSVEIMQTPARILLFYESIHTFRTIWMDGRKPPEDADPLWMGFSVGRWEGNDLVVDTTGFNDKTWINGAGYPHSEALHLIERFHRTDAKHMQLDITIDDPKAYAQPWKMGVNFTFEPTWEFGESFCIPTNQASFKSQIMEQNDKDKSSPKPKN